MKALRGFLLVEVLISISILALFIPLFCNICIQLQTSWAQLNRGVLTYFNQRYLVDFLYMDLSKANGVLSATAQAIQFRNVEGNIITYTLSSGRFGRKENASPTTYLYNSEPKVTSLRLLQGPTLTLSLTFNDSKIITLIP